MVADQQPPVQACDRVDESKRLRVVDGDRLLEEHGDAGLEALDRGVDVERVRVGDDDRVELLGIEHGGGASDTSGSRTRPSAAAGSATAASAAPARRSNEVDVLSPHEAGADDADANGRGLGCGHGASLRRSRCDGPRPSVCHDGAARGTRSIQRRGRRRAAARTHVPFDGTSLCEPNEVGKSQHCHQAAT